MTRPTPESLSFALFCLRPLWIVALGLAALRVGAAFGWRVG